MIKIDREYRINADSHCYRLERKVKDRMEIYGYYATIESALKGYIKAKTRKYIAKKTLNTLDELLKEIQEYEELVEDKFKKF